jgi:D-glycero-D-manno-heptose 1,7-bisphosphate phosphatase
MKPVKNKPHRRVIFLDRDGVINRFPGRKKYVTSLEGFEFLKGAIEAIRMLTEAGYKLFVVSNQAGVGKGLYSRKTLRAITDHMLETIKREGGRVEKVFYCLHRPETDCPCRKPKDGSLRQATRTMQVDKKNSYFIGDSVLDVKTGKKFGCKTILVLCGREKLKNSDEWDVMADFIAPNLLSAARNIVAGKYERA